MRKKSSTPWHYFVPGLLVLCVLFLFFSSADTDRYQGHFRVEKPTVEGEQQYYSEASIISNPHNEQWLIDMIDRAETMVYVAVYTFTLPDLREALARAHGRGVDVRVILEKNPYNAASINRDTTTFFSQKNIPYHLSDESQFAFMHAKYMVIDSDWIIETSNWTRSGFVSNREFVVVGDDDSIRNNLKNMFLADFSGERGAGEDIRVLAGPTNARDRLVSFIRSAKTLDMYAPSLSDEGMIQVLHNLCQNDIPVRIILALYDDTDVSDFDYPSCLEIRGMKSPTLHAKSLIRDDASFVGSFNYTNNSLENNREVGIFLQGLAHQHIRKTFEQDWKKSVAIQ